jgi:hypothetical protein
MHGCERIVDIYRGPDHEKGGGFVASYPISLRGRNYVPSEREYEITAIDTAIEDALARADERRNLVAHVRRR